MTIYPADTDETRVGAARPEVEVTLQPVAPPSILGLFALAATLLVVAADMLGWYRTPTSSFFLWPFIFFGGLAQLIAGVWAFRARDGLATALHGIWGMFFMAHGLLYLFFALGAVTQPAVLYPELGFWYIAVAAVSLALTVGALAVNAAFTGTLLFLTAGAIFAAITLLARNSSLFIISGWLFIVTALFGWYTATALLLRSTFGNWILPVGVTAPAQVKPEVAVGIGEPGVTHGQST